MERIRTVEKKVTASLQEIKAETPDCDPRWARKTA